MADKKDTEEPKAEEVKEEKKPAAKKKAPAKKKAEPKKETKAKAEKPEKKEEKKTAAKKKAPTKKAKKEEKAEEGKEEPIKDLKDIGQAVEVDAPAEPEQTEEKKPEQPKADEPRVAKKDELGRSYATGRRKDAVARVWIKAGTGKVEVNGKDQSIYFARHTHRLILNQPFLIVNSVGKYDVMATVKGGGLSGQAGAVRHGISRALENFDPELRPPLKKAGMLTRDARIVERKKVGKHKARRTKQWAKR